jgi:AcrR family transcriptional regulator
LIANVLYNTLNITPLTTVYDSITIIKGKMAIISFKLNEKIFLRDPQNTELGQSIIRDSICLIDEIGFEQFTFKKLAERIQSTEASVYRYFENKHRLLIYLIDWYWTWIDYTIDFATTNLKSPEEKLKACLRVIAEAKEYDARFPFVDEKALQRIIIAEFDKVYLTRQVDSDNQEGLFLPYKAVCKKIAGAVQEVNPAYEFPHSLISTILLSVNHQLFYARHLPSLTDVKSKSGQQHALLYDFVESVVFNTIGK